MINEADIKKLEFLKSIINFDKPITHFSGPISCDLDKRDDFRMILQGEHKSFVALDLQLKAIKNLIESADFKFDIEDDPYVEEKYILSILDSIGHILKNYFHNEIDKKNIELVKIFLDNIIENKDHEKDIFKNILDQQDIDDY